MRALYQRSDFPSYRGCRKSHQSRVIYPTYDAWTEAFGYLLACCLEDAGLELHGGSLFVTHEHFHVGHPHYDDAMVEARYSRLWEEFHFLVWRLLMSRGWKFGPAYSRLERTHQGPVLDADEFWRTICYDTAQAVAAGFFKRSGDYPGLVFLPEDVLTPRVFSRNSLIDELDPERQRFPKKEVSIQLGIPRIFSHLTRKQYSDAFAKKLKDYEDDVGPKRVHTKSRAVENCHSLSLGKRLSLDDILEKTRGHQPPPNFARGFSPFYSSKTEIKLSFKEERTQFHRKHKDAYDGMKAGKPNVKFPSGTYGWRRLLNVEVEPPESTAWANQPLWWPD